MKSGSLHAVVDFIFLQQTLFIINIIAMNSTHLHLLLNHFPVIGTLIGSGLLFWGIIMKQNNIKSTAAVLLFIMALIAIPVYLTGEPAEESIDKLPGVSETMIELHQDAATIAIWLIGFTGLFSIIAAVLLWQKRKSADRVFIFAFVLSVVCFAAMARTGYYGGQIRHSEVRSENAMTQAGEKDTEKGEVDLKNEKEDD